MSFPRFLLDTKPGPAVVFHADADRSPHFIIKAGAEGVVASVKCDGLWIKLAEHINGAEEWDNEVLIPLADVHDTITAVRAAFCDTPKEDSCPGCGGTTGGNHFDCENPERSATP